MCGFAGIVDASGRGQRHDIGATAARMTEPLRHRGPDDDGVWTDGDAGVAFGFRRLAILDLSSSGHQPMLSADGRFAVVFNGEIYNHLELRSRLDAERASNAWRGHSDTETLLACVAAWGMTRTLERAVGMFALALWDGIERRLYLARDRFGEKPLYYGWTNGIFVFGSELAALRRVTGFDNEIDRDVLQLYLRYGCVPAPYAIFKNIYKLQPGCLMTITPDGAKHPAAAAPFAPMRGAGMTIERYWSLADIAAREAAEPIADDSAALDAFERTLATAVQLQSIADVPLGAFLSGGIDSSLITAVMQAQSTRPVRTFTIGFDEDGFNEAVHAKAVAQHLGTDHTEMYVSSREARDVIPDLPHLYSEPFADSSQIPTYLVSRVARQQVTVALSGDGGDELLGGYNRYLWAPRVWKRVGRVPVAVRSAASAAVEAMPDRAWEAIGSLRSGAQGVARLGEKTRKLAHRLGHVNSIEELYGSLATIWPRDVSVVNGARPLRTVLDDTDIGGEPERRMMLWDALTYLPDDILHKVDRAAMGVSLETRAPFLDHRVAELAWRLPLRMKIRNGTSKWIARQLLYRFVPQDLVERPKMGFSVPIDSWLRGPLREWAEGLLEESRLRREGYFDPAPIRRKWMEHVCGRRDWQHELWAVLMFESWLGDKG